MGRQHSKHTPGLSRKVKCWNVFFRIILKGYSTVTEISAPFKNTGEIKQ
jgi:hypothetical protein